MLDTALILLYVARSLGIETADASCIMTASVERNSTISTEKSDIFTFADNLPGAIVRVYGGEHSRTEDNSFDKSEFSDISLSPRFFRDSGSLRGRRQWHLARLCLQQDRQKVESYKHN